MTIGDPAGINIRSLVEAIQKHYRTTLGRPVTVTLGGLPSDLPADFLLLAPTDESDS